MAVGALALAASGFVGCLDAGQSGNPARGFSSGSGNRYPSSSYPAGTTTGSSRDAGADDITREGGAADGQATDAGTSSDVDAGSMGTACAASGTATLSLAWSLEDATGATSTCDGVGGKTVDIDVVNLATNAEATSTVPCAALAATTCALPAGSHSVSMKLRDAAGVVLAEIVAPQLIVVSGQAATVPSLPLQVGGADAAKGRGFALTWSIDKKSTGAIESCTQAGAATIRLLAGATAFDLTCGDGKGRTTAIAPGTYAVTLDLLDAAGAKLSETQTMSLAIGAGQLLFLGDVPFDVD
ncbi:MAG TPA: hypothetical protein VGK52_14640 [Polyangia bacterium]|jgi:hypothetical protein